MKLIVGLGNPGNEYVDTRHNIGYSLLDYLCKDTNVVYRNKFNSNYVEVMINSEKIILVKPLTYMNLSGIAVKNFVDFYKIDIDDILIIQDDLDMNLGKIKFVYDSSSGGHNGIKDIEKYLNTKKYLRLKIGISNDKNRDTKDYVLGKFNNEELKILNDSYYKLRDLFSDFVNLNKNELMSKYNNK